MEKLRIKNQGITLIALVVTIVVLLILAAISISVLTGENGVINQSKKAKEDTEIAEEKEVLNLSMTQAIGEDVYGNLEEDYFREKLNDNAEGTELEKIGDYYKVTFPSEREYIVSEDGDINEVNTENTVELVAKLFYDTRDGRYIIGVGFEEYQVTNELLMKIEESEIIANRWWLEDYLYEHEISGTLIASNGEEFYLSTNNINLYYKENGDFWMGLFRSYCYRQEIYENGEYTFIFLGDDGRYGETTVKIDDENPQIVSFFFSNLNGNLEGAELGLMLGLNNFVEMEDAKMRIIGKNEDDEMVDLTPYVSQKQTINMFYTSLAGKYFPGEFTCIYQGKVLIRKDDFDLRYM